MTSTNNSFWYRANGNKDYVDQLISSDQRKDLIIKLKLYIKSCLECYFSTSKPLTGQSRKPEQDIAVFELCSILEYYLSHRIKPSTSLWSIIQLLPQLSTKNNLSTLDIKPVDWKEEFDYIFSLSEITTDLGRTRAFIRRSLNQSHLNQSFELIATSSDILKNHYEEGSILKFREESDLFRSLLVSLQTIPFQIDYNDNSLDQLVLESPIQEEDQIPNNNTDLLNSFESNHNNNSNNNSEMSSITTLTTATDKPKIIKKKVVKSLTRNIDLGGGENENDNGEIIVDEQSTQKVTVVKKIVKRIKVKKPALVQPNTLTSSTASTTELTSSTISDLSSSTSSVSSLTQSLDSSQSSVPINPPTVQTSSVVTSDTSTPILNTEQQSTIPNKASPPSFSPLVSSNNTNSPTLPFALPVMKQNRYSSAYVPSKPTTPVSNSQPNTPILSPTSLSPQLNPQPTSTPPSTLDSSPITNKPNIVNIDHTIDKSPTKESPTAIEIKSLETIDDKKEHIVDGKEEHEIKEEEEIFRNEDDEDDVDLDDLDDILNTLDQIELDDDEKIIKEKEEEEEEVFRDEDDDDDDNDDNEHQPEKSEIIHSQTKEEILQETNEVIHNEEVEEKQEEKNEIVIEDKQEIINTVEEVKSVPILNNDDTLPPVVNNLNEYNDQNFIEPPTSSPIEIKKNNPFKYNQEDDFSDDSSSRNYSFNINEHYYQSNSYNNNNNNFKIKSSSSQLSFVNSEELEEYSEDLITSNMLSSSDSVLNFNDYELLNDPEILEFIESSKNLPDLNGINNNNQISPKSQNNHLNGNSSVNKPNEIKFIDDYSLDDNQATKQQYSQVIKEEPKEFKWMPPRKRLFFNVQKPITLKEQNNLCAGCARDISGLFTPHRQCQYSSKHYCTYCHIKSVYYIPGHIISSWSFKMYPISTFYLEFLKEIEKDPLFDLSSLNAKLYKNQELLRIRNLRKQMFFIKDFLSTCSDGKSLMSIIEGTEYLCNDIEYFSLHDLVNHKQLLKNLRLLVAKWLDHVEKCPLCIAKGSFCEFCNDPTPIFPFHISRTVQCLECKSFHHKACYSKSKCPKCLRIAKRKILSNFDQARKTEQLNTFITKNDD